ncbi:MAG: bifunctional riboflavin kinase/FAD synthetase [Syntrophorhabdaceae bacterium]|nr:bifunctional riboflavin kinase/FAD synthetase [Syntrophorhabdaceae bacterium]
MEFIQGTRVFSPSSKTSITIGNFDGVHLGHRELIRRTVAHAKELGLPSVVLAFSPHPIRFLRPKLRFCEVTTVREKAERMEELGIDVFVVESFDGDIGGMSPEEFARTVLCQRLRARMVTVGYNFAFGGQRTGSSEMLEELGREFGFEVDITPPLMRGGVVVSSSRIRELLIAGKAREAEELLCRPFEVRGSVGQGAGRGRLLGFPTANVMFSQKLLLLPGVYVADVKVGDASFRGVANVGSNPTFGGSSIGIEAHLFDFQGDLYGKEALVRFRERIRDERKFQNADELVAQIQNDVEYARRMNLPIWEGTS